MLSCKKEASGERYHEFLSNDEVALICAWGNRDETRNGSETNGRFSHEQI